VTRPERRVSVDADRSIEVGRWNRIGARIGARIEKDASIDSDPWIRMAPSIDWTERMNSPQRRHDVRLRGREVAARPDRSCAPRSPR
jgi:hypothetical protein